MKGKVLVWLTLAVLILSPGLAAGDCVDLETFTNWVREDAHTVIFYMGEKPLARVDVPYCEVRSSSVIRLIKSYVCGSDRILVDGTECRILTVQILF